MKLAEMWDVRFGPILVDGNPGQSPPQGPYDV